MTVNKDEKRLIWQQHIDAWKSSGKTQQAYCDENNIKPTQMWYWNRRLNPKTPDAKPAVSKEKRASAFVPVHIDTCDVSVQGLTITVPNGLVIGGICAQTMPFLKNLIREVS